MAVIEFRSVAAAALGGGLPTGYSHGVYRPVPGGLDQPLCFNKRADRLAGKMTKNVAENSCRLQVGVKALTAAISEVEHLSLFGR